MSDDRALDAVADLLLRAEACRASGELDDALDAATAALAALDAPGVGEHAPPHWRAESWGMIGRTHLEQHAIVEARAAFRVALSSALELDTDFTSLAVAYAENVLVASALVDGDVGARHRDVRRRVLAAQVHIDRARLAAAQDDLERLAAEFAAVGDVTMLRHAGDAARCDDVLLYLPLVHGLLGFGRFHLGRVQAARAAWTVARDGCSALNDLQGRRIYELNIELSA